jgi:hypothetical protein
MKTTFTVSPSYRAAIWVSIPQQAIVILLSIMTLDFGQTRQICGMAFLAFWAGTGIIMFSRPLTPSRLDLLFIRFGFVPLFIVAIFLALFIWRMRGVL